MAPSRRHPNAKANKVKGGPENYLGSIKVAKRLQAFIFRYFCFHTDCEIDNVNR